MIEPRIVFRDDAILVLAKPSGIATTSPTGKDCLTEIAARLDPDAPALHATSRLDAEVSGLVVFARTRAANGSILEARRAGRYARWYLGLASAAPAPREGRWTEAISVDPQDARRRRAGDGLRAQEAATRYAVVATASASGAALLELRPETGRTHQLRVHAATHGAPLLGDIVYGGPRRVVLADGRVVTPRRVMLHCVAVALTRDDTARVSFFDAPPEDFVATWNAVGGDASVLQRWQAE